MILANKELLSGIETGRIHCKPFNPDYVGANSIDVHLGPELKLVLENTSGGYIDPLEPQYLRPVKFGPEGYVLEPGKILLGHTIEEIGSDYYVPDYNGRSSLGRMGLFSHVSAGWGEIGFKRQWVLELVAVRPILLRPGMRIGAVRFQTCTSQDRLYGRDIPAHYAEQSGAQGSKYAD